MLEREPALARDESLARLLYIADVVIDVFQPPSSLNGFSIHPERILDRQARGQKIAPLRDAVVGIAFESGALTVRQINLHVLGRTTYRNQGAIQRCLTKRRADAEFCACYDRAYARIVDFLTAAGGADDDDDLSGSDGEAPPCR